MNAYLLNTETMEFPVYEGELALRYPNSCFPTPMVNPPEPYVWVKDITPPTYDLVYQGLRENTPTKVDGEWKRVWEVYQLSEEEVSINEQNARNVNKKIASDKLSEVDWTATIDVSDPQYRNPYLANQSEFLSYRSQLSNIALNPPVTVDVWPEKPNEHWVEVK